VPAVVILLIGSAAIWRFSTQADVEQATETVPADSAEASSKVFDDRTLVILPFENLSSDPEQSYFASGLTMDMISQFTAWGIPVIRASRDHYSGDISPAKIAADLSVRNIVHGSVQRSRDRIRVNVNVVDAESGVTRYSQTFDREISGFFEMQDEMSIRIGSAVMGDIATARLKSVSKKAEHNLDAWGLYALGMQSALELGPETSAEAAAYFQRALELEPDFAEAKSWLGFLQSWRVVVGTSKDPEADLKGAVRTIRDALRLNPRNAQIHTQLAFPLLTLGDVKAAGEALQRAEELGGRTPFMLVQLAMVKIMENEPEASIEASLQAIKLDPHGPSAEIYYDNVAIAAFESGQYEMGLDAAQRVIAAGPQFHSGYWTAAANLVGLGRIEEAKEVINEARVQVPGISIAMIQQAFNYERPEADAKRAEALRTAGLD
jgi:TolB-like protein